MLHHLFAEVEALADERGELGHLRGVAPGVVVLVVDGAHQGVEGAERSGVHGLAADGLGPHGDGVAFVHFPDLVSAARIVEDTLGGSRLPRVNMGCNANIAYPVYRKMNFLFVCHFNYRTSLCVF